MFHVPFWYLLDLGCFLGTPKRCTIYDSVLIINSFSICKVKQLMLLIKSLVLVDATKQLYSQKWEKTMNLKGFLQRYSIVAASNGIEAERTETTAITFTFERQCCYVHDMSGSPEVIDSQNMHLRRHVCRHWQNDWRVDRLLFIKCTWASCFCYCKFTI